MLVTAHGRLVGLRSSSAWTVDAAVPASGAKFAPAAAMSESEICGRTQTCVKGIAEFSLAYCQRYVVALFWPTTFPPKEKPAW